MSKRKKRGRVIQSATMHIVNQPDKGLNKATGAHNVLTAAFRSLMLQINLTLPLWSRLMNDWMSDRRNNVPVTPKERTSMRGNLQKELHRERITWKVFLKAMRFMQVRRVEIKFVFHVKGRAPIVHENHVDFDYFPHADAWEQSREP